MQKYRHAGRQLRTSPVNYTIQNKVRILTVGRPSPTTTNGEFSILRDDVYAQTDIFSSLLA